MIEPQDPALIPEDPTGYNIRYAGDGKAFEAYCKATETLVGTYPNREEAVAAAVADSGFVLGG